MSFNSKKIKKNATTTSLKVKFSDSHHHVNHRSSPLKEPNIPSSAFFTRFKSEQYPQFSDRNFLKSSFFSKEIKEFYELITRKPCSKAENFEKIDEIVNKMKHPECFEFSSQIEQLKQMSHSQEQTIEFMLEQNKDSFSFPKIKSEKSSKTINNPDLIEQNKKEIEEKPSENINFPCEFIENLDFQINFSPSFKTPIKQKIDLDNKENFRKGFTIENGWKYSQTTPGTLTPCNTPLLERKRMLSSSKVEDMTDFLPENKEFTADLNELWNKFGEVEVKQWRVEDNEEWDFRGVDFMS